jgi:molybdopterin converting factor small subunit
MGVRIRYLGILKKYQPAENAAEYWETDCAGKTIGEVLAETDLAGVSMTYTLLVNGFRKDKDYVLQDGDKVNVVAMIAGG